MLRENKRNVTVITASVHRDQEGEQEYREIRAKGQLSEREGVLYVLYEEEMEGAERPVKNFLKIEPSPLRVSIKKSGGVCWKAVFEKGMRHEADYRTPYGALTAGVETETVALKQSEKKISLQLAYILFIQGIKQADCRLEIEIL